MQENICEPTRICVFRRVSKIGQTKGKFTSPLAKHIQNADNWLPTRNTTVVARIPTWKHKTLALCQNMSTWCIKQAKRSHAKLSFHGLIPSGNFGSRLRSLRWFHVIPTSWASMALHRNPRTTKPIERRSWRKQPWSKRRGPRWATMGSWFLGNPLIWGT